MDYKCKYCGRILQTKSAMVNHVRSCKSNPDREKLIAELKAKKVLKDKLHGDYICECGKVFNKKSSLDIHKRYCKLNPKSEYNKKILSKSHKNISEETRQKMRESHKGNKSHSGIPASESQKLKTSKTLKDRYARGEIVSWNKGKKGLVKLSDETKKKISNILKVKLNTEDTRSKRRVAAYKYMLTHKSINGGCKSYRSYFKINQATYYFRSSYELIFALYLAMLDIKFEYESVWVKNIYFKSDNSYGRVFLNDFKVGNTIIELKGRHDPIKFKYAKDSFESKGFKYMYLYGKDKFKLIVQRLKDLGLPMDQILENLKVANKSNKLFYYEFDHKNLQNLGTIKED